MPITRIFGFVLSMVMVVTLFSSISSAQRPLRWLGQGFSDGYHKCTPGPNSDYYNPYTAHNTMLISQNPGMYGMPQHRVQEGPIQVGVPFSVYAAPARVNSSGAFHALPGQPIENSYLPSDESESKENNDWVPDNSPSDILIPETPSTFDDPPAIDDEEKANDAAAYAPTLQGRVEMGLSRSRPANLKSNQVDFSKASFHKRAIGELVDERIETGANLVNPFDQ